ncbi:helicase-related protein [Deinococcus sp. UYEF24]
MSRTSVLSRLLDNHTQGTVGGFLKQRVRKDVDLSVVSAYFTIHAYAALEEQLEDVNHMRFLFGEPSFLNNLDSSKGTTPAFHLEEEMLKLHETLRQNRIAERCADWIARKVEVRSVRHPGFLHGKMFHIENGDYCKAVLGSSNFTVQGLGLGGRPNIELNLEVTDDRDREDLKNWFDTVWNDLGLVEDVKSEVLKQLERLYAPNSPQFVYFKTLYHLFEGFQADEQTELKQPQHLFESDIWNALFEFQKHGAQATLRKLLKHGGSILADSVGLGKTYTALAVIKYFENLNYRVLVLCPKKLRENWTVYQAQNNSPLNPFLNDRFGFTVLSHTDLSREDGQVGDINLGTLNWGNFDLIVIDESHNFRNNTRGKRDENGRVIRKSRYERLLEDILNAGIKSKVLLLSATPVNNDLADLRNQLNLIVGGNDSGFQDSLGMGSLKSSLATAQREFTAWSEKEVRTSETLLERLSPSFFGLLDELTLARSRAHIRRYYPETLAKLGGFPERDKPISIYAEVDSRKLFPGYAALFEQISGYKLALFSPSSYLRPEHRDLYEKDAVKNFSQGARESHLIGMMKVNFLKRLESSVHSFTVTLERTLSKIGALESQLEGFMAQQRALRLEAPQPDALDDDELADALMVGKSVRYDLRHLNVPGWLSDLKKDREQLEAIQQVSVLITPQRDQKLAELRAVLEHKILNPTHSKDGVANRKTLVFTAFADTAQYLYRQLEGWARERGVHIGLVVGSGDNRATLGRASFGEILTNFSPVAKRRDRLKGLPQDAEIDLLIATDCISEGQNLQDCDLVVNYDIHWNPVRLIQRFGRIDRIGSRAERIGMVNFWPTDDLNAYLNLKNRVEARMALVDLTATAQDNPLTPEQAVSELSYRDQQLMRLKDEVLDLEDLQGGVTLADFSLDDFRMDLSNYLEQNLETLRNTPLGIFGLVDVPQGEVARQGIVFCLRQVGGQSAQFNPLSPYFLVYVRSTGEVRFSHAQARQTLDLYRVLCAHRDEASQTLHDFFDNQTRNGEDMAEQDGLLKSALESIRQTAQRKTAQSLFSGRSAVLPSAQAAVSESTEFELITWLAILETPVETL